MAGTNVLCLSNFRRGRVAIITAIVLLFLPLSGHAATEGLAQGPAAHGGSTANPAEDGNDHDGDHVVGFRRLGYWVRRLPKDERLALAGYCGCDLPPGHDGCQVVLTADECRQLADEKISSRHGDFYSESFPLVIRSIIKRRSMLDPQSEARREPGAARGLRESPESADFNR